MAFDMGSAETFLRTFSPPVIGLNGEIVNTPYLFVGVLHPPPRTPLAASSLSTLRKPRDVYASQPANGASPTILLVDSDSSLAIAQPRGVPASYFPYNNTAHAVALNWCFLQELQQALVKSVSVAAPVDPVAIYRQVLRDYEYRTMVLGQNRNLYADNSCSVSPSGEGMMFRGVTGETAEAFFQRQLGPETNVVALSASDVRPWAHSYADHTMVDMAMDSASIALEKQMQSMQHAPADISMEFDTGMFVPLTPQTSLAQLHNNTHAHPPTFSQQQQQWIDTAVSFTNSKKRKLVDATSESCRKVARLIAKPHFRNRPAPWATA